MFSRKVQHALSLGLLFFVISSPMTYRLVDSIVGRVIGAVVPQYTTLFKIAEAGCPTNYGLFVHSVVFALAAYGLHHYSV